MQSAMEPRYCRLQRWSLLTSLSTHILSWRILAYKGASLTSWHLVSPSPLVYSLLSRPSVHWVPPTLHLRVAQPPKLYEDGKADPRLWVQLCGRWRVWPGHQCPLARTVSGCRILLKKVKLAIRGAEDEALQSSGRSKSPLRLANTQVYLISI